MMKIDARGMKVLKIVSFCFILSLSFSYAFAGIGDWKSYTDMKSVRAVTTAGNDVWVGTSGGVFRYSPSDSTYLTLTNAEGLSSNDVTAIAADMYGNIWIGESNGSIDVYSPQTRSWKYISDITSTDKTDKRILSLTPVADTVLIGTGFGAAIFSISKFEFRETINNFGGVLQPTVNAFTKTDNRFFVLTSEGFIVSKQGATNLSAPDSWELLVNDKTGNSLALVRDTLFAGSSSSLYFFSNNSWTSVLSGFSTRITSHNDTLYYTQNQSVFAFDKQHSSIQKTFAANSPITDFAITSSSKIFAGFSGDGIGSSNGASSSWKYFFPNGPGGNSVTSLAVDNSGTLWAASGKANGKGFYSFNGVQWRTYSTSTTPMLTSNDCFAIAIGPNNSKWVSTWGGGLYLVNSAGTVVRRFDQNSPGFIGITNDLDFIVPSKVAVDHANNIWTSIYISSNPSKVVWKMSPDSVWQPYPSDATLYNSMLQVVIDQYDTKWFGNRLPGFPAIAKVVYFNEKATIGTASNGWGNLQTSDGLTSTGIYDIAIDKDGDIWFATDAGITIVTNPKFPQTRITRVYLGLLRDLQINCIAVDPMNNKWIGTNIGVFVLNADGTSLLNQYNVSNTSGKLVSNSIMSIAFDTKKGIAYFGTEKGLSALGISAIASVPEMISLQISPNPAFSQSSSSVEVRGLADDAMIKVLSIHGKLVRQFPAQGAGRAFWDMRDMEGNLVGSGVYIITAYTSDGGQIASGKVAIVNK